jgi:hypothetical protein
MLLAMAMPGRFAPRPMVASLDSDFSVLAVDGEEQHEQEEGRVAVAMQYPQVSFVQKVSAETAPTELEYTQLKNYANEKKDVVMASLNTKVGELPARGTEVSDAAIAYGTGLDNMRVHGAGGAWKVNHDLKSALHKYHARENLDIAEIIKQQDQPADTALTVDDFVVDTSAEDLGKSGHQEDDTLTAANYMDNLPDTVNEDPDFAR